MGDQTLLETNRALRSALEALSEAGEDEQAVGSDMFRVMRAVTACIEDSKKLDTDEVRQLRSTQEIEEKQREKLAECLQELLRDVRRQQKGKRQDPIKRLIRNIG